MTRFLIFFLLPLHAFASGEMIALRGRAWINKVPAQAPVVLKEGDTVETGPNSVAVVKWGGRSIFKIEENSSVRLSTQPRHEGNLNHGSVMVRVEKLLRGEKGAKVFLRTRTTALAVRGTEFYVAYGRDGDVWTCVNEGQVALRSRTERNITIVNAGEGVVTAKGFSTSKPEPVLWTKRLNWTMTPAEGDISPSVKMKEFYADPLGVDYD